MAVVLRVPATCSPETDPVVLGALNVLVEHLQGDVRGATRVISDLALRIGVRGVVIDPAAPVPQQIAALVREVARVRGTDTVLRGQEDLHRELERVTEFAALGDPTLTIPWIVRGLLRRYDLQGFVGEPGDAPFDVAVKHLVSVVRDSQERLVYHQINDLMNIVTDVLGRCRNRRGAARWAVQRVMDEAGLVGFVHDPDDADRIDGARRHLQAALLLVEEHRRITVGAQG